MGLLYDVTEWVTMTLADEDTNSIQTYGFFIGQITCLSFKCVLKCHLRAIFATNNIWTFECLNIWIFEPGLQVVLAAGAALPATKAGAARWLLK